MSSNIFTGTALPESSSSPLVSSAGRYIVFASRATNVVVGDTNGATDVFAHDRTLHSTFRLRRNGSGSPRKGASTRPVLAPDGRTILFTSFADNLSPGDFNNRPDVFAIRLGGPDTDADGIDDEWELAYFGNLDRNGSGDADRDGASDIDEYRAGTSPVDEDSIFRVLSTTFTAGDSVQNVWNSEAGHRYRVQSKSNIDQLFWTDLDAPVTATGLTAFYIDRAVAGSSRRFHRVAYDP